MNYLDLFSIHNLALLSDWLEETGELYVDVYLPHSGGSSTGSFVHSIQGLKSLVARQTWKEIAFTIFRQIQYPLRGIANEQLLEQALTQIPEGYWFNIISLERSLDGEEVIRIGSGQGHTELRQEMQEAFGELVGVGIDIGSYRDFSDIKNTNEVFEVAVTRNQNGHRPYVKEPKRYQWIEAIWKA